MNPLQREYDQLVAECHMAPADRIGQHDRSTQQVIDVFLDALIGTFCGGDTHLGPSALPDLRSRLLD